MPRRSNGTMWRRSRSAPQRNATWGFATKPAEGLKKISGRQYAGSAGPLERETKLRSITSAFTTPLLKQLKRPRAKLKPNPPRREEAKKWRQEDEDNAQDRICRLTETLCSEKVAPHYGSSPKSAAFCV